MKLLFWTTPVLFAGFVVSLLGQDPTAVAEGIVADKTGGAIPGAEVTVKNPNTGFSQHQITSPSGTYSFPVLPVWLYQLTVQKAGFANYQSTPLQLNVNQTARLNIVLEVATATESVEVEADVELV